MLSCDFSRHFSNHHGHKICSGYEGAEGDLTVRGEVRNKDELGQLTDSFNQFMEKIQSMTRDIYETTITLNRSSKNLLEISEDMAANSEEVNGKTGVVSAAVEQISVTIDNAASASDETSKSINTIASAVKNVRIHKEPGISLPSRPR